MSSVAADGRDGHGLKLEMIQGSFYAVPAKIIAGNVMVSTP